MATTAPPEIMYSCEICGQDGMNEDSMRIHMTEAHVTGAVQCPFCDLAEVTTNEMSLHVNTVHLEYLTPEREDVSFLEDSMFDEEMNSVWDMERQAKDGYDPAGPSPMSPRTKKLDTSDGGSTLPASPMSSTSTETSFSAIKPAKPSTSDDSCSSMSRTTTTSSIQSSGAIQKRRKFEGTANSPSKSHLSLNIKPWKGFEGKPAVERPIEKPRPSNPLSCPLCDFVHSDPNKLQTHVNRMHFDLTSPSTTTGGAAAAIDPIQCPFCAETFSAGSAVETHVNRAHADILSPVKPAQDNGNLECPVCGATEFVNRNQLAGHVDKHFSERERERREFSELQAKYGMDNEGNFTEQSIAGMQKAVFKGKMSVTDYHERQIELREREHRGMDDGRSITPNPMPRLRSLVTPTVSHAYLSSFVDHHASSFGDKGWGCGYRNLQMLLSSLMAGSTYSDRLRTITGTPSISRLQQLIEGAWQRGFDLQGRDQLGGKLVNTRKWIGATEIVAFLTAHRIRTELVDFHVPTARDGTHPRLFQWVLEYFRSRAGQFTPPLYFQHQGHSRTIVGVEVLQPNNRLRLLVFDPSHSPTHMHGLMNDAQAQQTLRSLRKNPTAVKSRQYQIVAVTGVFQSEEEAAAGKVLRSKRIP